MKTSRGFTRALGAPLLALSVFAVAPRAPLFAADDVTGDWEIRMERNGRESFGSLSIAKKPDGALTGKWGATELSDVKFDGSKLTFVRTVKFGDQEFKTTYEGTLKDGSIAGTLSSERGSFPANAARKKPRSPVAGRWSFQYKIADRDITATLALSETAGGALEAKWTSNAGEHVVSDVKFQGGKLTFSRKSKVEGNEFETTYDGKLDGNKLVGTFKADFGDFPADGERVGASLIGQWELTTTTDRGTRTNTLTVFNDLTGRYEFFGSEIPFKDLKLEGNDVAFTVETAFGDQPTQMEFKGKIDGKTLKGQVTSPRGTREVTGKKLESAAPAPSPAAAVAGTWEITRQGQNGPRKVKLTIKEDLTGTYTYGDNNTTVGVTDLRLMDGELSFKVTVKYGENDVPMEFKGKVDGSTLKGQFTSSRGTREATGKKLEKSDSVTL
jgi:hypothetical protein